MYIAGEVGTYRSQDQRTFCITADLVNLAFFVLTGRIVGSSETYSNPFGEWILLHFAEQANRMVIRMISGRRGGNSRTDI